MGQRERGGKEMGSGSEEEKMVRRLKEILHDRSEQEIYDALKECGMDPGEAVQRLLSQDTFHEVKSKRERRKEKREMQDIKSSIGSGFFNEGWSFDHEDEIVQSNPNAQGIVPSKRENDSVISPVSCSSSAYQTAGETSYQQSMHDSDSLSAETRGQTTATGSIAASSSQPPTQSESCGPVVGKGRPSVASIVRRGSLHSGLLEFSEISLNYEDAAQASDGHSSCENLSSIECSSASTSLLMSMNDVAAAHHGDGSHEQMTSNGENTCRKVLQEVTSDVHRVSYLGEPLPEQTSEDTGTVVLPSNLQALAADCPHLSFGTYDSKSSSTAMELHLPNSLKIDSESLCTTSDGLSTQQLYTKQFLPEMHEPLSTLLIRQQLLGAAFGKGQISIASDLVSRGSQNSSHGLIWEPGYASSYRKEEVPRYSSEMNLTPHTFPSFEPSSQASYASHGLPNQLLERASSQHTDLLKHYANLNSHLNVSHEYGQVPFHRSLGNTKHGLPQYKRDDLQRNLAIPNYDSSGSGGSHGLNTLLGDFLPSSTVTSNLSAVGYNKMLQNQILKDANHFPPHGLVDNGSIGWDYKAGSGTLSNARANAYYNLLLEQQRNLGRQQDQQYSQDYGSLVNSSSYHSQVGAGPDNQLLQSFGDMTLNDHADTLSKQNQFWQQKRR